MHSREVLANILNMSEESGVFREETKNSPRHDHTGVDGLIPLGSQSGGVLLNHPPVTSKILRGDNATKSGNVYNDSIAVVPTGTK